MCLQLGDRDRRRGGSPLFKTRTLKNDPYQNTPLRVLIVDDDPDYRSIVSQYLAPAGYEVTAIDTAAGAMRFLLDTGADVVLTDWIMPEMSGVELCRAIRAEKAIPFVYILLMTVQRVEEEQLVEAFEAGADEILQKPLTRRGLIARMQPALRLAVLQKELARRQLDMHRYNAEIAHANRKLEESNWKLRHAATTDELTGLPNRRAAFARLNELWLSSDRYTHGFVGMVVDIDHFKPINDTYGHAVGDRVLRRTAELLLKVTRRNEMLCRMGGEEFLVLCPHTTEDEAAVGAERMRRAVENNVIKVRDDDVRVTVSLGVAGRTKEMTRPDDLIRAADDALYAAKAAGRNAVCTAANQAQCRTAHAAAGGTPAQSPRT